MCVPTYPPRVDSYYLIETAWFSSKGVFSPTDRCVGSNCTSRFDDVLLFDIDWQLLPVAWRFIQTLAGYTDRMRADGRRQTTGERLAEWQNPKLVRLREGRAGDVPRLSFAQALNDDDEVMERKARCATFATPRRVALRSARPDRRCPSDRISAKSSLPWQCNQQGAARRQRRFATRVVFMTAPPPFARSPRRARRRSLSIRRMRRGINTSLFVSLFSY